MEKYTYAAAYVKCLENLLLTKKDYIQLSESNTSEAENLLKSRGYDGENLSEMLENGYSSLWDLCIELCGDEMEPFIIRNDFHNIKAVFKSVLSGEDWSRLIKSPSNTDCVKLAEAFKSGDFSDTEFADICPEVYSIYSAKGIRYAEAYLDKSEFTLMTDKSSGFTKGYVQLLALCADLRIYLRSRDKSFLQEALIENSLIDIDYLKRGADKGETLSGLGYAQAYEKYIISPSDFERYCTDLISEYIKSAENSFFDFDAVLAYFVRKETEFKNIRLTLYAGEENPEERLMGIYA